MKKNNFKESSYSKNDSEESNKSVCSSELVRIENELRSKKKAELKEVKPLFIQDNHPAIYKKTINLIQGQTGSHKSRIAGEFASAAIKKSNCDKGVLNLEKSDEEVYLIYIDTERELEYQFPKSIQTIEENACLKIKDDNLDKLSYTSLINTDRKKRIEELKLYITDKRKKYESQHLLIIIDVLTDLVEDFNDPAKSLDVYDYLNNLCNELNCTIIGIIHENPGSNKARGHIGTEGTNKASTVYSSILSKSDYTITIKQLKNRNSQIAPDVYAKYDAKENCLVSASKPITQNQTKINQEKLVEFLFTIIGRSGIAKKVLYISIMKEFKVKSETTVDSALKGLIGDNILITKNGFKYKLEKSGPKNNIIYKFKKTS